MRKEAEGYLPVRFWGRTIKPTIPTELTDLLNTGGISDEALRFYHDQFLSHACQGVPNKRKTNPLHWLTSQAVVNCSHQLFCPKDFRNHFLAQEVALRLGGKFINPDIVGYVGGPGFGVIEIGSLTAFDKKARQVERDLRLLRDAFEEVVFFGMLVLYAPINPKNKTLELTFLLQE